MKLKCTLGVVIGALVAGSCAGVFAQGQGAVELETFAKYYRPQGSRDMNTAGALYGGGASYFLTDDVALGVTYGEYHELSSNNRVNGHGHKDIQGNYASLDATYHFGQPGVGFRPYVSTGIARQSLGQVHRGGRENSTYFNLAGGVKYYVTDMFFAKASIEGLHNIDNGYSEWQAGVGVGINFGGSGRKPVAPTPAPEPVMAAAAAEPAQEPIAEVVRVELDVKFDFNKASVRKESYKDIQDLANFMQQYPSTRTVVEGHTDSVGTDQYNQRLSERRAQAVRHVLVDQYGVASNRVDAVGYGESRPIADNATEAGRQLNRRVEAEVEAQVKQ